MNLGLPVLRFTGGWKSMAYKNFKIQVLIRVVALTLVLLVAVTFLTHPDKVISGIIFLGFAAFLVAELYRYISYTNRKLTRFLESVKYSDFLSGFSVDNQLGSSFKDLNIAFNDVMDAIRKARTEKAEHLSYLNTVVEHVSTGLLAYDVDGEVVLINEAAKRFLKKPELHNIDELIEKQSRLYKAIFDTHPGKNNLFGTSDQIQLTIHSTTLKLSDKTITLVALQNIQSELQKKELDAWQNLTKVLRHEIMNSITPIASLTSTLQVILNEDLIKKESQYILEGETVEDINEGLETIESRSNGLIRFIDAYREYTSIPKPKFKTIAVEALIEHIASLMKAELKDQNIEYLSLVTPKELQIQGDDELLEMVLINLFKNGIQATGGSENRKLTVFGKKVGHMTYIEIIDNGQGIIPEAINKIFIPFYTTKKEGSGIGLSLSRQIMQLHHGSINVESEPSRFTKFTLGFPNTR